MDQCDAPSGELWPVLTVKQPYVSRIMQGDKTVENRSWMPHGGYRGRLYIHASMRPERHHGLGLTDRDLEPVRVRGQLESVCRDKLYGAIVGHVTLTDVITDSDHWSSITGFYHWLLEDPVEFREAIPTPGRLQLWRYHG